MAVRGSDIVAEFYVQNEYWFAAVQLILAMLGMGATLTGKDFRDVVREPMAVSAGTLIQLMAVPVTAFLFLRFLGVGEGVAVGIALIAAIPGGTVSNIFTFFARGNSALSISITAITTLACLVTTPLILSLLISNYLPLALGMAYLYLYPRTAPVLSKWCIRGSLLVILLIVLGSVMAGRLDVNAFGLNNILLVVAFALALMGTGYLVPRVLRLSRPDVAAIEFEVIVRNVNLGVLLKASIFPAAVAETAALGDMVLFSLLLYGGLQLIFGGLLISFHRRSPRHVA
jgi:BASS family bile acid:Na+ symporter